MDKIYYNWMVNKKNKIHMLKVIKFNNQKIKLIIDNIIQIKFIIKINKKER